MKPFADRLFAAVQSKESAVVVGLDPDPRFIPASLFPRSGSGARQRLAAGVSRFLEEIVAAVASAAVAVKPQLAYFERLGPPGFEAYERIVACAREHGLIVIADGKRNDIAATAEQYAAAYLGEKQEPAGTENDLGGGGEGLGSLLAAAAREGEPADALTVNAYLGSDGVLPFLERAGEGRGLFVLVKTSNPSSGELQDAVLAGGSVAERVASWVEGWSRARVGAYGYGDVGAVVGATYPEDLARLRTKMPHVPFLIPGFGAQGGGAADVAAGFDERGLGAVVNASRSILYAYRRDESLPFAEAARLAAIRMRDEIRREAPLRL